MPLVGQGLLILLSITLLWSFLPVAAVADASFGMPSTRGAAVQEKPSVESMLAHGVEVLPPDMEMRTAGEALTGPVAWQGMSPQELPALRRSGWTTSMTGNFEGVFPERGWTQGNDPQDSLVSELHELTGGEVRISTHAKTGMVRFIGTELPNSVPQPAALKANPSPEDAARGFLSEYGGLFGLVDQSGELKAMRSKTVDDGRSFVRFQQVHEGIPIVGGELIIQVGPTNNSIVSANGEILPRVSLDTTPAVDASSAREAALNVVVRGYGIDPGALTVSEPELWIYSPLILGMNSGLTSLVWRMEVESVDPLPIRELVLVDAHLGAIALHFNQIETAKDREVYDTACSNSLPGTLVRSEGEGPTGDPEQDNAYDYTGDTYDFYWSEHGRDSIDNAGMTIISTVDFDPEGGECDWQNAFWDGSQTVFGTGWASADDVVAHEMTHGVTDYESNLFYFMQSGAINEAFSDVWGEFVDLTNGAGDDTPAVRWKIGEDSPVGAFRDMSNPPAHDSGLGLMPDRMTSPYYLCGELGELDFGGVHHNMGVGCKAAYLMVDGDTFNGYTVTGMGISKTADVWYEVQTNLFTSASDYADLYDCLQQAAINLGYSAADRQTVTDAVNATEMNQQPTVCPAPEAPICDAGVPNNLWFDDMENTGSGNWASAAMGGANEWYYPQNSHPFTGFDATYATSGSFNIWGHDHYGLADYYIAMTSDVALPANAYLHFNHDHSFDDYYTKIFNGGVLEYSTNGGGSWADAGPLFTDNGYNGTIGTSWSNPLGGRAAFVSESNGYISSRVDLSALAGQSIRFRFRIGTSDTSDPQRYGASWGWFIDDVRIYTCEAASLQDVVQVTTDAGYDYYPAITQTADGRVWAAWTSLRSGNWDVWYKTSSDGGASWSAAAQVATDAGNDLHPAITRTADGRVWVAWYSYRSGNWDVWYKTSSDGGASWSPAAQVTTDAGHDYYPAITQTDDGRVWAAWSSYRSGNEDVWYKTSSDGGASWSAAAQVTTDAGYDFRPAITQTNDGEVWVAWYSYRSGNSDIWYRTSSDGGASWSPAAQVTTDAGNDYLPAIAQTDDGRVWAAWTSYRSGNADIWYKTSSDGGATWSGASRFTSFAGYDSYPAAAALSDGKLAVAWMSDRAVNYDIWYGVVSATADMNPPPYLAWAGNEPYAPDTGQTATVRAWASDESGIDDVQLVWSLDGVPQGNLPMYDDGAHDDYGAGDGYYGVQLGPFPVAGTWVDYQVQVTDIDENTIVAPQYPYSFQVVEPFVKTADILLVGDRPVGLLPYYSGALDALGYAYDVWDSELRGNVDGSTLNQYAQGTVIWAVPSAGHIGSTETQTNLASYLDGGGSLFISGQDIGFSIGGSAFYQDYLHAQYVQDDVDLYALFGVPGDPISDGLYVYISGGDGANNQSWPSEIDPIPPAVSVLDYDPAAVTAVAEASVPQLEAIAPRGDDMAPWGEPMAPHEGEIPLRAAPAGEGTAAKGIVSSGSGAVRVDTGVYRVVYFAFGFEAINSAANRATVMERVLDWIGPYDLTVTSNGCCPIDVAWGQTAETVPAGETDTFSVPRLAEVTLTADDSDPFCQFIDWTGDESGTDNPLIFTMDDGKDVTGNCSVSLPHAFYGAVEIDGSPAPIGTEVKASGEGVLFTQGNPIETTEVGHYGSPEPLAPKLIIQGKIREGTILTFYINGKIAETSPRPVEWHGGEVTEVDLSIETGGVPLGDHRLWGDVTRGDPSEAVPENTRVDARIEARGLEWTTYTDGLGRYGYGDADPFYVLEENGAIAGDVITWWVDGAPADTTCPTCDDPSGPILFENMGHDMVNLDVTGAAYSIPLGVGWNLVSPPLVPASPNIEHVLAGIMGNIDSVWAYENNARGWSFYAPGEPSDLTEMKCDRGYWIKATAPCTLTVVGVEPASPYDTPLGPGWNLIGLPLVPEPEPIEEVLADIMSHVDSVWAYENNARGWSFYAPGEPSDLTEMRCDRGYWIKVDVPCTLSVGEPPSILKVGYITPLSGPAGTWGVAAELGANWCADRVNEGGGIQVGDETYMIETISCDDQLSGSGAATCATDLIYGEGADYLMLGISEPECSAVAPIAEDAEVLWLMCQSEALSPETTYSYSLVPPTRCFEHGLWSTIAQFYPEIGTAAIIYSTGLEDQRDDAIAAAEVHGVALIAIEDVEIGTTDFYPYLTKIIAKDPGAIEIQASGGTTALIVKQARELGYRGRLIEPYSIPMDMLVEVAGAAAAEGHVMLSERFDSPVFPAETNALYAEFYQRYPNEDLDYTVYLGYTMMDFLVQGIEAAQSVDPTVVRDTMDDPCHDFTLFGMEATLGGLNDTGIPHAVRSCTAYGQVVDGQLHTLSLTCCPPESDPGMQWTLAEGTLELGLPPGAGALIDVAVVPGTSTVFVLCDQGIGPGSVAVYRSDDGGHTWEPPSPIAVGMNEVGVDIEVSGSRNVFVLTHDMFGGGGYVYTSPDGGVTWPHVTAALPTSPTCLAIDPYFEGLIGGSTIAVGGIWDGIGACVWYEVWQGPVLGWSGAWTLVPSTTAADCLALTYAPTGNLRLISVQTDGINTYGATGGLAAGFPALLAGNLPFPGNDNGADRIHAGAATSAVIALGSDYDPVSSVEYPSCPMYFFVGTDDGLAGLNGSTFWFDPALAAFADLKAASTLPAAHMDTSGLVAEGTYTRAHLLTGCANVPITYNVDVRVMVWSIPVFIEGNGGPIGVASGNVGVILDHGSDAYAITTQVPASAYGIAPTATPGDLTCLSRSTDFGGSWSDTCLTQENFWWIIQDQLWTSPTTGFIVCDDGVGQQSVFKTWTPGKWKRVDRWQDVQRITASPDGAAILLLDTGATGAKVLRSLDDGESFTPTPADPTAMVTDLMTCIAAGTSNDIFVGSANGRIYSTHDGGETWTDSGQVAAKIKSLDVPKFYATVQHVAAGVDGLGDSTQDVLISKDDGATWAPAGAATWGPGGLGTAGHVEVKFSPTYTGVDGADNFVYAGILGTAFDSMYRADVSAPTPWTNMWVNSGPAGAGAITSVSAFDIVRIVDTMGDPLCRGNVMYVTEAGTNRIFVTYYPELASIALPMWRPDFSNPYANAVMWQANAGLAVWGLGGPTPGSTLIPCPFDVVVGASATLFGRDNGGFPIPWASVHKITETTCFLTPPACCSPCDGEIVPSNNPVSGQPVALQWTAVAGALDYDVQLCTDMNDPLTCLVDTTVMGLTELLIGVGTLEDGETYYWRTRVARTWGDAGIAEHTGPWSAWCEFTVGVGI